MLHLENWIRSLGQDQDEETDMPTLQTTPNKKLLGRRKCVARSSRSRSGVYVTEYVGYRRTMSY